MMTLGELIQGTGARLVHKGPDGAGAEILIHDIHEDSRVVSPGSLFIARAGTKDDGTKYVRDAIRAGASALLVEDADDVLARTREIGVPVVAAGDVRVAGAGLAERFFGYPGAQLSLIGVTGTNGKTTTTWLTRQLLNAAGVRCGLVGTVMIDDGAGMTRSSMTTPGATHLSRLLSCMVANRCRAAAMEVSSHALDQRRADGLRFRVGVFTNLTGDHLDYHKTMEQYARAKRRLFEMLPEESVAIINAHDPLGAQMAHAAGCPVLWCRVGGVGAPVESIAGDCCLVRVESESIRGMELSLAGPWGRVRGRVALVGAFNAMNVLQAVASAHGVGATRDAIEAALPTLSAPPGRLEAVESGPDTPRVFVDFAHSDDALANVLRAVRGVLEPGRRLWVVFGCGGEKDATKRPRMGRVAVEHADRVIVTSDNPRREDPASIVRQITSGIEAREMGKVWEIVDRAGAIREAVRAASAGDAIVLAGKGHELEQILPDGTGGTRVVPFDDRAIAREALLEATPRAQSNGDHG